MPVPEAVRRQAEENEKALDEAQRAIEEQSSVETPEAEAEVTDKLSGQPEETETALPDANQALQRELDLERQRTASLKGRIDSQLAQANGENKELKAQLAAMQERLDEMAKASAVPGPRRHISEEEANDLGEDVLGVQERIIKGTLEEELESGTVKEFVQGLIDQSIVAQQQQKANPEPVNEELYWAAVERYYPDAKAVNDSDQEWFKFLSLHDQASGKKNREVGIAAIDEGDVVAMVDLLTSFKPLQANAEGNRNVAVKPERTGADQIVQPGQESEWTEAEVAAFYADVQRGKFRGTKAEAIAMEDDIMKAAQEGRIRG